MNDGRRIVVVGGGIIGIACAHFLNRAGYQVTIVDKGRIGGECSHGNCGLVCPSHVLPLAEPGALGAAFKSMLSPQSPFHIRPRLDRGLWKWLWNFARRCNQAKMLESGRAIQPLLASSLSLYTQLVEQEGIECEWKKQGLLFVYKNQRPFDSYTRVNDLLTEEFNEPARRIGGPELGEFEPSLRPGLAGGWYFEHDAHLRPDRLVASWRAALQRRGVRFVEQEGLDSLIETNGVVRAAKLEHQTIEADRFVIATGAWTPRLAGILRVRIPIEPGKGYSITLPRPSVCPRVPLIFPEHRVAVTPLDEELRIGSIMEFAGYDATIRPERLRLLTEGVGHYLRGELPSGVNEKWFGWRPMTYDSTPVIGPCPGFSNVFLATGHNMLGLSMAPATGRLISELISGQPTHLATDAYSALRFTAR